jgi:hypothetical protein
MKSALEAQAAVVSRSHIEWTIRHDSKFTQAHLTEVLGLLRVPSDEEWLFWEEHATCDITGDWVRFDFSFEFPDINQLAPGKGSSSQEREKQGGKPTARALQYSFNGTHIFTGKRITRDRTAASERPTLLIYSLKHAKEHAQSIGMAEETTEKRIRHDYWRSAGFLIPSNEYRFGESKVSALVLHLANNGNARVTAAPADDGEGARVVVETSTGTEEFWLDPTRAHCVMRHEARDREGRLLTATSTDEFVKVSETPELFLPKYIHTDYYQWVGRPLEPSKDVLLAGHIVLDNFESVTFPQKHFELDYSDEVGTLVGDDRLPGAKDKDNGLVSYAVPADMRDLDAAIQKATTGDAYVPAVLKDDSSSMAWLLWINVCGVVVLAVFLLVRRFR